MESLGADFDKLYDSLSNQGASLPKVDQMVADAADLTGEFEGRKGAATDAIARASEASEADFAAAELELTALLSSMENNAEAAIHDGYMKGKAYATALISTLEDDGEDLATTTQSLKDRLAKHAECATAGAIWDAAAMVCVPLEIPAKDSATKVHHRMFNNADGRDAGYVNNRYLIFNKLNDATYMRIWYHDNFRVHGHTAHAQWDIMICDANGNGCAECKDPGKVQHWRWAQHQHNWWMNDHWSASTFGICKKSDNRDLKKGKYQLKVRIDSNRNDIYTGHNQHNMLMVDEVLKG